MESMESRINGNFFSLSDLSCASRQLSLRLETLKLNNFIIGGDQYTYTRRFDALCGLPNFFSRLMTIFFDTSINKEPAIT